jgi:hypothetical protein
VDAVSFKPHLNPWRLASDEHLATPLWLINPEDRKELLSARLYRFGWDYNEGNSPDGYC